MPMAGPLKKHHEAVVVVAGSHSLLGAGDDDTYCTPVRRPPPATVSSSDASPVSEDPSAARAIEFDMSDSKKRRNATPSTASPSVVAADSNKRKRKSAGGASGSAVKALAGSLLSANKKRARVSIGTPGKATPLDGAREQDVAKRFVEHEVTEVYKTIRKQTGALGGNAAGGAIYGEITQASFQRIVDYLKAHCELSEASLFLDVGSGLGKPNFHVAIDPGVEVSYGVELEELRWHLSLHNLRSVLQLDVNKSKRNRTMFSAGDITDATTLNPFSHVYSFDVGFPPTVMDELAAIFNRSTAGYFVSFHAPRKVIDVYGFEVENLGRLATSMAGSSEGHTCYFYRRLPGPVPTAQGAPTATKAARNLRATSTTTSSAISADNVDERLLHIDPLFREGFDVLRRGRDGTLAWIVSFFGDEVYNGRTRGQKAKCSQARRRQERPLESYYRVVGKARVEAGGAGQGTKKQPQCA
ncbi:hypothetical protein PybrP1_003981 [[Pythium] brassicae (nom. inval.)]|nr:hypothetical protein PybrP1_003981 [[Pythium] brassicae (nom. inval.)]